MRGGQKLFILKSHSSIFTGWVLPWITLYGPPTIPFFMYTGMQIVLRPSYSIISWVINRIMLKSHSNPGLSILTLHSVFILFNNFSITYNHFRKKKVNIKTESLKYIFFKLKNYSSILKINYLNHDSPVF